MSRNSAKRACVAILSLLVLGAVSSLQIARAEEASEDQIRKALAPPAKETLTRGLSMAPPVQTNPATDAESKLIQSLRNRPTRSLSTGEREQIADAVKDKPKIDLEISFDYNSD